MLTVQVTTYLILLTSFRIDLVLVMHIKRKLSLHLAFSLCLNSFFLLNIVILYLYFYKEVHSEYSLL